MGSPSRAGASVAPLASDLVIAGRYQVERELGGGGMARVYAVLDAVSGSRLALKRPDEPAVRAHGARLRELFAREFHTLAELAHPRIVEVYDFGVDERGPYYTMELLDGGDLEQLAAADALRVCAIARDVCSALSLLHSRRIVHRDVSPRNVRLAADGVAKLIDFGAMCSMGSCRELIGTPALCSPESFHLQPLDARTDLYALGATLYFALTGRHAYPVQQFASLPEAWAYGIPRPSELRPGIPAALESLVLDLLHLDAQTRPNSAAEVMERLAGIDGRPVDEHLLTARADLSLPAIVGRDAELARLKTTIERSHYHHGNTVWIEGPPGVGRSRFLDAAVLAGKVAGAAVVRADADDAEAGDYGVVRALVHQLREQLPDATRKAAESELPVLLHAAPELGEGLGVAPKLFGDPSAVRPELQSALQRFWLSLPLPQPLVLAIDDLDRADEPSAASIALLARGIRHLPITIVATVERGSAGTTRPALALLLESAVKLPLENLSQEQVGTLLRSVFGASSELDALARRVFAIAHGNPRDVLRLAQHLVDRGVVRYRGGAWAVPSQLDASELPSSVAQMLGARVAALSPSALALACALALCPEHSFSFDECGALGAVEDPAQLVRDLEQLAYADILRSAGGRYTLADRAWAGKLLERMAEGELRSVHHRLARTLERRTGEEFRTARHYLRAGETERAIDLFIAHATASLEETDASPEAFFKLIRSLPPDFLDTYREALQVAAALKRPKSEVFRLRTRAAGLGILTHVREGLAISGELVADLRAQSGLDDWAAADANLEPMPRLIQALERTQARFDAMSGDERVLDPASAIRALARNAMETVAATVPLLDLATLKALPSLEPLAVLSPALSVIQNLIYGVTARLSGRTAQARDIYRMLLDRTAASDRAGLTESHHRYMRLMLANGLGMIEASMGLRSSLALADTVATDPLFKVNAVLIRMVYHLWQGDTVGAERCERQIGVLRLQLTSRNTFENTYLVWSVAAHAAMDDLTRLQRTLEEIRSTGSGYPGWRPVLAFARAELERVRGDRPAALAELERCLAKLSPGDHQLWSSIAGAHVRALDDAGRCAEALACGDAYLAQAADHELETHAIQLPLAVAAARAGRAGAAESVQSVLDELEARGTTGLAMGLTLEARCRVAIAERDDDALERYGDACAEVYAAANNPALAAKRRKLERDARRRA